MRNTTLLLPFALPPATHARDLLAALDLPALALLLARAAEAPVREQPPFSASLPHELLLAGTDGGHSPPLAHALMARLGLQAAEGHWFVLQPAHFHIARDHLVLTDLRSLALTDTDARPLFDAAAPLFAELGHELVYGDAQRWFVRADDWADLRTCTPDAATGHNVDVWLPAGSMARQWRKLHNEVQMLWHLHPLNEARESRGLPRVNALWLWGGASPQASLPAAGIDLLGALATSVETGPLVCDLSLVPAALAGDWSGWLTGMRALETAHLAPQLAALRAGRIDQLTLQLTDASRLREWRATRAGMRKFWRKPALSSLSD